MAAVRALTEKDIPAVVALFERVYPDNRWESPIACERYLHDVLFSNPWFDPELPSWICEEQGRATGFAGVVPRPMQFRGDRIRAAVGCLFMVDPDRRKSLIALRLVQAALSGPQDLFIADGSNEDARRIWLGAGGSTPLLYSLHWIRLLRPARYALSLIEALGGIGRAAAALRAPGALVDTLLARLRPNRFLQRDGGFIDEPLDAATMSSNLPRFLRGSMLHPVYDAPALSWLLGQAALKTRHGDFRARAVFDRERRLAGWFLYYARRGEVAEVLQVIARHGSFEGVLQLLLLDAWRHGATAVRGRLDPAHAQELSDRHCWLRREGPWTLFHSRHAHIVLAIERGGAELSRLDGEWWMRFLGG